MKGVRSLSFSSAERPMNARREDNRYVSGGDSLLNDATNQKVDDLGAGRRSSCVGDND